ncbi:MAG: hypothetical protein HY954_02900 [Deltaproteobacteria bacterium]|nr:hypothetical protein [Deltaproteobacteria bacterium]
MPIILFTLLFIVASAAIPGSGMALTQEEEVPGVNPHNFSKTELCSSCHQAEPPLLNFDAVTTCTKCHSGNVGNHPVTRHPIGKMPRIKIPAILPLTDEGQMVCYTCHDPHNKSKYPKMLRVEFRKLCGSCHAGY